MAQNDALYMGFDLSTQQLKCVVVNSNLQHKHESKVDFDEDFGQKYGIQKGVLTNPVEGEVFAPTVMWLEAVDLVLQRVKESGLDFSKVRGVSGAGMQHGTVFWSKEAEGMLKNLDSGKTLLEQMENGQTSAFAHPHSPNWQDASTQKQCDEFDEKLGSAETLAEVTGSNAHHRFSGPQIMRFRTKYPGHYANVSRISLVSSFLASVFVGHFAPIDISDVTGMDLWDVKKGAWHDDLIALAAGGQGGVADLKRKLGDVPEDGGYSPGNISEYFVNRFGFQKDTNVICFTGDNPSTILALPLRASDAMVSLGTSTTFLMSTDTYKPDPAYHFMNHPTTPGLYMFMLCYKNGGLAREQIRDQLNTSATHPTSWDTFNDTALTTSPLAMEERLGEMRLGLYFPRPEIVPNVSAGQWRYSYNPRSKQLRKLPNEPAPTDARNIVESQMLSLRLRSQALLQPTKDESTGTVLPPQPRRVYLVGGGSANQAIAQLCGEVLGSKDGIYKLDIGGNACALGSAYKAVWACERKQGQTFEDLIGGRWDESKFVKRVADGYKPGVFETYGQAVDVFRKMEKVIADPEAGKMKKQLSGGVFMGPDYDTESRVDTQATIKE